MIEPQIRIFTIGFTKKTAEEFFTKLIQAGVRRVIDVRLNNASQLTIPVRSSVDLAICLNASRQ